MNRPTAKTLRTNPECLAAKARWRMLPKCALTSLEKLVAERSLSITLGDLLYLNSNWYVTHSGLLRVAARDGCAGISVVPVREFCDLRENRWSFRAIVYKNRRCKGFVGYGDADPSNVSPAVRGAEMRIAETRAVNRALRKAYGIGICSVEELGSTALCNAGPKRTNSNEYSGSSNGDSRASVRDRLNLLIRKTNSIRHW
jgi:hypothetical protein